MTIYRDMWQGTCTWPLTWKQQQQQQQQQQNGYYDSDWWQFWYHTNSIVGSAVLDLDIILLW